MKSDFPEERFGWSILAWGKAVGISRGSVYNLISAGRIDTVKFGVRRLIVTHPRDFLASLQGVRA